jgi:microsomal epoxide hydrolase
MIKEFNVNFTEKEISLVYQKVKDYPWDSIVDLENWDHGTNKSYLKELCDYWIKDFDWSKHRLELNNFQTLLLVWMDRKFILLKKKEVIQILLHCF